MQVVVFPYNTYCISGLNFCQVELPTHFISCIEEEIVQKSSFNRMMIINSISTRNVQGESKNKDTQNGVYDHQRSWNSSCYTNSHDGN